jgi:hypothetical protein
VDQSHAYRLRQFSLGVASPKTRGPVGLPEGPIRIIGPAMSAPKLKENWREQLLNLKRDWDSYDGVPICLDAIKALENLLRCALLPRWLTT